MRAGRAGATMRGLDRQQFRDPPRRTRGGRDFVPHLRQFAERGCGEHGEQHELRQESAAHAARQHVARAEPQHEHHAAEGERHRNRDEERPGGGGGARRVIGAFDFVGETRLTGVLGAEGLHGARGAKALRSERRRFGEGVLGAPRPVAHHAPRSDERRGDDRDRDQHQSRQFRARIDHERGRAHEHEQVPERGRGRRTERRLDLRRVGGEARYELARPRAVVERGVEARQMREHIASQISDHALAERGHQIVAGRGRERDDDDKGPHGHEIDVDRPAAIFRKAEVDHRAQSERHRERRRGGHRQGRQRAGRPAEIAPSVADERKQRRQGRARFAGSVVIRSSIDA